ncbi:hypothetical protein AMTRI_Chr08g163000 [Amborella trichopoda]
MENSEIKLVFWSGLSKEGASDPLNIYFYFFNFYARLQKNSEYKSYFVPGSSLKCPTVGIVPDGRLYQLTDIKQALKEEIGEEVGIRCSTNLEGEFQLYEVYVCIDKSFATGVIPCPTLPFFTCSDEILFPAFNVQMLKKNGTRNSLELQVE